MPRKRITTVGQDYTILAKQIPDKAIAKAYGLTERQIWSRRYTLTSRSRVEPKKPSPLKGREEEIRYLLNVERLYLSQAADRLGVSLGTLSGYVRRHRLRQQAVVRRFDHPRVMVTRQQDQHS
jgi:hypothetical protein